MIAAADFLQQAEDLPFASLQQILGTGGVVVLAPHPDDESLGCGGLLAAAAVEGRALAVVFISDGSASHPNSRRYEHPALQNLRKAEALAALAALGIPQSAASFLGLSDTAVPEHGAAFDAAVDSILETARSVGASALLATWGHDPHCDHHAVSAMAAAATASCSGLRHLAYPVWGHTLPPGSMIPGGPARGARLEISPWLPAKWRAILAHRSQTSGLIDDDPQGFTLDAVMLARFDRPFEIFLETVT